MMNNEELENKMAFIVNQQAQFAVNIEKLHEAQILTAQSLEKTDEVVTRLAYVTSEGFKDVNAKINALVDSQIRTDDQLRSLSDAQKKTEESLDALVNSQKQTDEQLKRTDEQLKRTDERLNQTDERLSKVLDRLDRRSNNGGSTD